MTSTIETLFKFIEDGVRISIGRDDEFPYVATAQEDSRMIVTLVRHQNETLDHLVSRLANGISKSKETGESIHDNRDDRAKFVVSRYSKDHYRHAIAEHIKLSRTAYQEHFYNKLPGYDLPFGAATRKFLSELLKNKSPQNKAFSDIIQSACRSPIEQLRSTFQMMVYESGIAARLAQLERYDEAMLHLKHATKYLAQAINEAKYPLSSDAEFVSTQKRAGGLARADKIKPVMQEVIALLDQKRPEHGWQSKEAAITTIVAAVEKFVDDKGSPLKKDGLFNRIRVWSREVDDVRAAFERNVTRTSSAKK